MPFLNTQEFITTIYEYNRGDKTVRADPALIWRRLNSACRSLGTTFDDLMKSWNDSVVNKEDTDVEIQKKVEMFSEIEPKLEEIARAGFQMSPIDDDGNGATVAMVMDTLREFLTEREKKSSNIENLPSSSPPSGGDRRDSSREFSASKD